MTNFRYCTLLIFLLSTLLLKAQEKILYNAFSHNDYKQKKPLFTALDLGFNWVEADVHIVENSLYVMHDPPTKNSKLISLEEMYFKPLDSIVKLNNGKVYRNSNQEFNLLIDFKIDGEKAYKILKELMVKYQHLFSFVNDTLYFQKPIRVIISGSRPFQSLPQEKIRYAFLDGRIEDIEKNDYSHLIMPLISDSYFSHFQWNGIGKMSKREQEKLHILQQKVHEQKRVLRFWGAPKTKTCMKFFIENNLDVIGADNLKKLYLLANDDIPKKR